MIVATSVDSALLELGYEAAWFAPFSVLTELQPHTDDRRSAAIVLAAPSAAVGAAEECGMLERR